MRLDPRPPNMAKRSPERKRDDRPWHKRTLANLKAFFSRLFYIISLVWESSPMILIGMILLCVFDGVLPVVGAYISKDLLNSIATLLGSRPEGDVMQNLFVTLRPVLFLLLLEFIYQFLKRVLERINGMITTIAGELVVNHIKLKIIGKAKDVDLSSFDSPEFYEKLENANREAGMRPISILNSTFRVISAVISVASFIAVLTTLSPWAPVIIILAAIPGAFVNYYYRNKNYAYLRWHSKERREMGYYSNLMVSKDFAKEIKILGLGNTFIEKYKAVFARYFKGLKKLIIRESVVRILINLIFTLTNCLLFAYVAYDVVFRNGMIGDYSLYSGALNSVVSYVSTVVTATATIYEGTLFIDNMMEFMREEKKVVSSLPEPIKPARGVPHTIELRGVSFSYPGSDKKILNNLNMTFNSGESVVLVGLNGAGKTTLLKLIMRLYDVTEGEILLDGRNIKEYEPDAYYDLFGIIFQDFGMYAQTARENISFGGLREQHKEGDVEAAARAADAHGFISELPNGYDTALTRIFEPDGIELSGGQWQKLSVARAFYKSSDILILDEPTASLDALAEQEIFNQFFSLSEGKISIYVSHRLSSATTAGKIVVLSEGRIAEIGNHDELMEKGGIYHKLFTTQASHYIK